MGDKKTEEEEDPRLEFILGYMTLTCKLKHDKWAKMISTDDFKNLIFRFFNVPEEKILIIQNAASGLIVPHLKIPAGEKSKITYFCKKKLVEITEDNFRDILIPGDMSPKPIDELSLLIEKVYIPLLTNVENQHGWPNVVANDVIKHVYDLRNSICQLKSKMSGRTFLPMPMGIENIFNETKFMEGDSKYSIDLQFLNNIEDIIMKWTTQINKILEEKSTLVFSNMERPIPFAECEFWHERLTNLEYIYSQFCDPRVKTMALYLEAAESHYLTSLKILIQNVAGEITAVREIFIQLKALKYFIDLLDEAEFEDLKPIIKSTFHCICLIWANSRHYCSSTKLINLLKQLTNMIIEKTVAFLDPSSLLQDEIEDSAIRLDQAIDFCQYYKNTFEFFRDKVKNYFKPQFEAIPWGFHHSLVFQRLKLFHFRLKDIKSLFYIATEYLKLEKVELTGLHGKILQDKVNHIYNDFFKIFTELSGGDYELLEPEDDRFSKHFTEFLKQVDIFDRKLAVIFGLAFAESFSIESMLQMTWIMGGLAFRPLIEVQIKPYYNKMFEKIHEQLDLDKILMDKNIEAHNKTGKMIFDSYFPTVAGNLSVLHKLKTRNQTMMEMLKFVDEKIKNTQFVQDAVEKYTELMELIQQKEEEIFEKWCEEVPTIFSEHMSVTLFTVKGEFCDKRIEHNFHPEIRNLLNEACYMNLIGKKNLPEEAVFLFSKSHFFHNCIYNLKMTVHHYNKICSFMNSHTYDLVRGEIEEIDEKIDDGIANLTWTSPEIDNYLQDLAKIVRKLCFRLERAKQNIDELINSMSWAMKPILKRREDRINAPLVKSDMPRFLNLRYEKIEKLAEQLPIVLEENYMWLFGLYLDEKYDTDSVIIDEPTREEAEEEKEQIEESTEEETEKDEDEAAEDILEKEEEIEVVELTEEEKFLEVERRERYKPYLKQVDELLLEKFTQAALTSVCYLLDETKENVNPLFVLRMELDIETKKIVFIPSLTVEDEHGFFAHYLEIIQNILKMGAMVNHVDPDRSEENYQIDLEENERIAFMIEEVGIRIKKDLKQIEKYPERFDQYSWLWTSNLQDIISFFEKFGRMPTIDEIKSSTDLRAFNDLKESHPSLSDIREKFTEFDSLYKKCYGIEDQKTFSLFRVDVKPVKNSLLKYVDELIAKLKENTKAVMLMILERNHGLLKLAFAAFSKPVDKEDYDNLVEKISYLNKIRDIHYQIDDDIIYMKQRLEFMHDFNISLASTYIQQVQQMPDLWLNVQKLSIQVKQVVNPFLDYYSNLLNKQMKYFIFRIEQFLKAFLVHDVFNIDATDVYSQLNDIYKVTIKFHDELEKMQIEANIFKVQLPEFEPLNKITNELKVLKLVWDYVFVIRSNLDEWKTTIWEKIDVEEMDQECKNFVKELRSLPKNVRNWKLYIYIESQVKNMMSSLKAVSELQNPAIKSRHWMQLMAETQVRFTMDSKTTLEDLLNLELHKYEEEVKNIVDKAVKEMVMEKALKEITNTWKSLEFEKEFHKRANIYILKITDETIEILEDHQLQLLNMLSSKFVGHFLTEVTDWQIKLKNADYVTTAWFEVQISWKNLESIFIGSEDIRNQLPTDSKRFDSIDRDFKELVRDAMVSLNIVRATNKPKLLERLEYLKEQLTLCEKALTEYLETKRLAYPRFYFVSAADLIDILSNGNYPPLVCRHLSKLYDSIANLKWRNDKLKTANIMVAKDGELMKLYNSCDCTGKVEDWLNRLTEAMQRSVRHFFSKAIGSYTEKARELWIFDHEAQSALCGTQIWWTTQVEEAFSRLEEGFENAMKDYQKKQIAQLTDLINLLVGELTANDRQKIMTICTIDVHARDVVASLISMKAENSLSFQWQSQLKHGWSDKKEHCFVRICDAYFDYCYEYLGNGPRLVITPLTDRCYITLTQSLHLIMGGAPAGPAGTGKTETTKDLGKALGQMVYVFNCSEQMDYKSCANIYKGLAQTGAWGCFDEFNRISIEVLSVVAVQVKSVLDGIKSRKKKFIFFGEELNLIRTVGIFITMNPGYAGRTELPENLKTLFRPCAMVVPDFALICEIMLVAEGFQESRLLARKFITLYTLCKELLSKQDHYDWGLRAIKSVLVIAGKLKREDRLRPENEVLMRALRDFNISKIVTDDVSVFMGLIEDLFPALNVPRKKDLEFESLVRQAALDRKLQPEDNFILKIVQLEELLFVRHSVFIVGFSGTGKTEVWKTLFKTYANKGLKPIYNDLDPKAVTNDELFGIINPNTREWKDGLVSILMRDQANLSGDGPKWLLFDGDIDPMWIESLNTVMDDNKVLTLASNERIALTKEMRLLFEISHLRTATPATVSRAGILYINLQDLGWNPYVASWVETRDQKERANLILLFEKYVPSLIEVMKSKFKKITPIPEICHIESLCRLLDCLLTKENVPPDCPKEWYEIYFAFACIWAFGSCTFKDQIIDWRNEFSKWWNSEFKTVKFPTKGTVFNYYIDPTTKKFLSWNDLVEPFTLDHDVPLQFTMVSTGETVCLQYFMGLLMNKSIPLMMVGGAGSGKSVLIADQLAKLTDNYNVVNVPFNYYTTSEMLQQILEKQLERKIGRNFGPPGNKKIVYFVDDMNMPEVDLYGTVQPHTIIRQHLNYKHWYDRQKLTLKEISNTQYVASMNPTAGSFSIDSRLQRHFTVFSVSFPEKEATMRIYSQILKQHLTDPIQKIKPGVQDIADQILGTALYLHTKVESTFLPTAVKFHYSFNLRDLSNIFQGMLFANDEAVPNQNQFIRLYIHEATRVYCDKLVNSEDKKEFHKLLDEALNKNIQGLDSSVFHEPNIFCHFAEGIGESKYMPIKNWNTLHNLINEALLNYQDLVAAMDLVMFEDAMYHVCRINRILESPRGNALLVGVGGSGKQSLSRLACFISSLQVFQIQLKKGYSINDLKSDLAVLYHKAGLKNVGITFLMTDSQVPEERFLVVVNDMLATGEIPDLFQDEERDEIIDAIRPEVLMSGLLDTKENCWKFFIHKVMKLLKCILCFSPVSATLRKRSRQFPALVNCTSIDWFQDWPKTALESVSVAFLQQVEELPKVYKKSVSLFMSYVHTAVNEVSQIYLENDKRYNYTTPKTFLEQIDLYSKLLKIKITTGREHIERLRSGLTKLANCSEEANTLKVILAAQEVELKAKNEVADKILAEVQHENAKAKNEQEIATGEEAKVAEIKIEVEKNQKKCDEDLARAEPAVLQAEAALDTLNKNNLTEFKSLVKPPDPVIRVAEAVYILMAPKGDIPKDKSWKACKAMMGGADDFLSRLRHYDRENIHPNIVNAIQPYIKDPEFDPEFIASKSQAAAGLCSWVKNIMVFHYINEPVKPLRAALAKANAELKAAMDKLNNLRAFLKEVQAVLDELGARMDVALAEKQKCQKEADATALSIDLANRLVNGLASEKVRWDKTATDLEEAEKTMPGDVLILTAFISYVGSFTKKYRTDLMNHYWIPYLDSLEVLIPRTPHLDPISLLTNDAQIAQWNNEGLPSDRMSTENATILINSTRWPLIIDPQLQGIKWIKNMYGEELIVLRLTQKNYMDRIEVAVTNGNTVLIDNILETVDAVMDNILGRVLIKKGRVIQIGDKEVDYNPNFKLILHTKLANPHYKPEMQAQTTLINFTVTKDGLEEQMLEEVLQIELEELAVKRVQLTRDQNNYKIIIKKLEDDLLERLSSAGANILSDANLVNNLEEMKQISSDVENMIEIAIKAKEEINLAREEYRSIAALGSILYFAISDLFKINMIYQFSLKFYTTVFKECLVDFRDHNPKSVENTDTRITDMFNRINYDIFLNTSVGLFEQDKLKFLLHSAIQILLYRNEIPKDELDFLLRYPYNPIYQSPVSFLTDVNWCGIKYLSEMDAFRGLDRDIESAAKRWQTYVESETPEKEKLPQEWKNKTTIQKLCIMRCLRLDRMTYSIRQIIHETLNINITKLPSMTFEKCINKVDKNMPLFFILSPGVDPLKDVEKYGEKLGFTISNGNLHNVSLGQGQEVVAERVMETAGVEGHWVILQNVHLVAKWLPKLERLMETITETAHDDFRLFISAEPHSDPHISVIPQGILESCLKMTNEPPTGIKANIYKALDNFSQRTLDTCTKETEFKAILFALCYYHAVVAERRKFGPQGWNRIYPFNFGDLTISAAVLANYLENNVKVPWEDLRYLFGEIMYGGHITDDWDRRLCRTYLSVYLQPHLVDGELFLAPGFLSPTINEFEDYYKYVDNYMPDENPTLYGLQSNAEIGFMTYISENMFKTIFELQPKDITGAEGGVITREDKVHEIIEDIYDRIPEEYSIAEFMSRVDDLTPYTIVAFQECDRMNILCREMRRSLQELELGLKGTLTINAEMEDLQNYLYMDIVPESWSSLAYPSNLGLTAWYADLLNRAVELTSWSSDFTLPSSVWLGGFFNPQSFLTAIMQQTARKNEWPLDKMCLHCEVTKKQKEDFKAPPREGSYINSLNMEGARWELNLGSLADSKSKEMYSSMPIVYIRAIAQDKLDLKNTYECPVYKTKNRGPNYVWTFNLKTRENPAKWTLAGVAIILEI